MTPALIFAPFLTCIKVESENNQEHVLLFCTVYQNNVQRFGSFHGVRCHTCTTAWVRELLLI